MRTRRCSVASCSAIMRVGPHQSGIDISITSRYGCTSNERSGGSPGPNGGTHAMKVAIIGAGHVGTALATSIGRAGHEVIITSRDPEDADQAAEASGALIARSS